MTNSKLGPRGRRTRKRLQQAYTTLRAEKPYRQITVVDISRHAGVDRDTFYRYFGGKDWLLFSLHEKILDYLIGAVPNWEHILETETPQDLIENFRFACAWPDTPKLLIRHEDAQVIRVCVEREIQGNLVKSLEAFLGQRLEHNFHNSFDKIASYLASGQVGLMLRCAQHWSDPTSMATMCHRMRRAVLLEVLPEEILHNLKNRHQS